MNGCVSFLGSCLSDTVSISNLSTNGSDLYNFMVQNNKLIELKKFEMIPSVDPEIENVSTCINELCDIYYIDGNIHPPPHFIFTPIALIGSRQIYEWANFNISNYPSSNNFKKGQNWCCKFERVKITLGKNNPVYSI